MQARDGWEGRRNGFGEEMKLPSPGESRASRSALTSFCSSFSAPSQERMASTRSSLLECSSASSCRFGSWPGNGTHKAVQPQYTHRRSNG